MSKPSVSTTRVPIPIFERLLPPLLFALVAALSALGAWEGLDRSIYDEALRLRVTVAPLAMSPRILPIDLNDRAERELGEAVDDRQAFGELFRLLGEGRSKGGIDFLFSGKRNPVNDAAMAEALGKTGGFVLAIAPIPLAVSNFSGKALDAEDAKILRRALWHPKVFSAGSIPRAETFLLPNRELARSASSLGHIGLMPDKDGLYRKVPLFYRWEDGFVPSLPLALAALELGVDPSLVELRAGVELVLPGAKGPRLSIPIDESGSVWIPYPSLWSQGWKRIPLDKVLAAALHEDSLTELLGQLDGSVVIAADITTSHKDFGTTALEPVYPLSGIHTSVLNGILTATFFRSTSLPAKIFLCLGLGLGSYAVSGKRRGAWFHGGFAAFLAASIGLAGLGWFRFLVVPWLAGPLLGLAAAWLGSWSIRLFKAHEERILLESALSRYLPRSLAARVLSEKKTELKPTCKELTILFADIAGFTLWSAEKDPEVVHGFLDDYLSSMALILFEHGGTVDKFMGDGILAFFGDPFDQPDHVARCLRAALAMQERVRELRSKWTELVGIDLKIRIGVNSGRVIVGNLGSKTRIEYTVIGAAVNLASRMESNAPLEGILVARDAWREANRAFRFGQSRAIVAKGYEQAIEAYVLEGEVGGESSRPTGAA